MQSDTNDNDEPWQKRVLSSVFGLFAFSVASVVLGALKHHGDLKEDEAIRARLSDSQFETISVAAFNDTCGSLHPKLHRICTTERKECLANETNVPSL